MIDQIFVKHALAELASVDNDIALLKTRLRSADLSPEQQKTNKRIMLSATSCRNCLNQALEVYYSNNLNLQHALVDGVTVHTSAQ